MTRAGFACLPPIRVPHMGHRKNGWLIAIRFVMCAGICRFPQAGILRQSFVATLLTRKERNSDCCASAPIASPRLAFRDSRLGRTRTVDSPSRGLSSRRSKPPTCAILRIACLPSNPPSLTPRKTPPETNLWLVSGGVWWEGVDSNHRSRRRQIYSLMHLATLQPARIKFLPRPHEVDGKIGAGDWNRTHNLLITNQLLCQLSYASKLRQK